MLNLPRDLAGETVHQLRPVLQILYSFPPEKPVAGSVASFCFPHGVNPVLLERTPSMSSLNEIIYGQKFLHSDACSFVFLMKVTGSKSPSTTLLQMRKFLQSDACGDVWQSGVGWQLSLL